MLSNVRNFFLTFVISLIIFGIIAFFVVGLVLDSINVSVSSVDTSPIVQGSDNYIESDNDNRDKQAELDGNSFNMLFLGLDYAPALFYDEYNPKTASELVKYDTDKTAGKNASDGEYRRVSADTILLVCVSKENKEFAFSAISPNTLITRGSETKCLGDIFEDEGLDKFISALEGLCGITVDRYALVDLENFANVIDIIEGVDFNVPCNMQYDDYNGNLHINIKAGYQHLDGKKSLEMLRFNKYEDTSGSRLKTTMAFARAVMTKMTDTRYITKAAALFREAQSMIVTDFTAADLSSNLDLIFSYPNFDALSIELPGAYSTIDGKLCFIPNVNGCISTLAPYQRQK